MKILALQAENVKKLSVVNIKPDGNMVEITGPNGAGKTSVLDSIWWALAGSDNIQTAPIRKDAEEAIIKLDLGDLKVTRTFKRREDKPYTTTLIVENADGARFTAPQTMLDGFLGALSFDPLKFVRMSPKEQFDALKRFVPGIDFEALDAANRGDYQRRTEVNREAREKRAAAQGIIIPAGTPDEPIDIENLTDKLAEAGKHNSEIENAKYEQQRKQRLADDHKANGVALRNRAAELREQADKWDQDASEELEKAAAIEKEIDDAAGPPVAPIDTDEIYAKLNTANATNSDVERLRNKNALNAEAEALETESEGLTKAMDERAAAKRKAIEEAEMPIAGLGFGDGVVLYDGVPFDQASDAAQLRVSVAIACAANPKLRVLRIRDGSLLDSASLKLLAEMADELDYQMWIERVDESGKVGFVLEDGHLKGAAPPAKDKAAPVDPENDE